MPRKKKPEFCGWRVEDDSSRAFYRKNKGIFAEASNRLVPLDPKDENDRKRLLNEVESHLEWKSDEPTPFISVYGKENPAKREAHRRKQIGHRNVIIHYVEIPKAENDRPIYYRHVPTLMEALGSEVPEHVGGSAEDEFIFLHHIPGEFIYAFLRMRDED